MIYNDYGRYPLFRGNNQEALHYFRLAYEEAKGSKDIHTYHVVTSNLIMRMAVLGFSRTECEDMLNAYREHIKMQSVENMVEFQNCQITYCRQIEDDKKVFELIRAGYEEIGARLPHRQKVMFKASTFRMLMNGQFVHDWFDPEVKQEMAEYLPLDLMERLQVFKEYMGILEQTEFSWLRWQEPYKTLRENIMDYYKTTALDEINAYLRNMDSSNVYRYKALVIPLQEETVREYIDEVIALCDSWQNHPARLDMSVHIAHILMCLGRREEAERFYRFFKSSNLSTLQFSSWVVDEIAALEREFDLE